MVVAQALYLIAPAVLAGVVHGAVIKRDLLAQLAKPLDGGRQWRGRPVLGPNKTWRGLLVMSGVSTIGALAQSALGEYDLSSALAIGLALGLGYSVAELPNSFVKRRLGIGAGETRGRMQYLADQADSVIGATVAVSFFVHARALLVSVVAAGLVLHIVIDELLYVFEVKQR